MVSSRTLTALVGLAVSVLVSVALYWYTNSFVVFLFVPFVPFLFRRLTGDGERGRRPEHRECPECGFRTVDPEHEYCPRDGRRLERRPDSTGGPDDRR